MTKNFLKLNMEKSQLLICGKENLINVHYSQIISLNNDLHINSAIAQNSKILGVFLDSKMTFALMINETCKICYFKLMKLRNLRHYLSQEIKIMLVKCFIISRLDYCNSLYACIPQYLLNKLKKVLNACIRFIFNLPIYSRTSLLPYYKECHILPIDYRIQYKLCLIVFKTLHNFAPVYLKNLLHINVPLHDNLRSSTDLHKITTDNLSCHKTISFQMCTIWNLLPYKLRASSSLQSFKTALKTHFFKLAFNN